MDVKPTGFRTECHHGSKIKWNIVAWLLHYMRLIMSKMKIFCPQFPNQTRKKQSFSMLLDKLCSFISHLMSFTFVLLLLMNITKRNNKTLLTASEAWAMNIWTLLSSQIGCAHILYDIHKLTNKCVYMFYVIFSS